MACVDDSILMKINFGYNCIIYMGTHFFLIL